MAIVHCIVVIHTYHTIELKTTITVRNALSIKTANRTIKTSGRK